MKGNGQMLGIDIDAFSQDRLDAGRHFASFAGRGYQGFRPRIGCNDVAGAHDGFIAQNLWTG